jgi:hypothetical protein
MAVPSAPATRRTIDESTERLNEAKADMDRRWGVFYLNILKDAAYLLHDEEAKRDHVEPEVSVNFNVLNIPPCETLLPSQVYIL